MRGEDTTTKAQAGEDSNTPLDFLGNDGKPPFWNINNVTSTKKLFQTTDYSEISEGCRALFFQSTWTTLNNNSDNNYNIKNKKYKEIQTIEKQSIKILYFLYFLSL